MAAVHFTKETFESDIRNKSGVALVDFWAPWCGPCQMLGPIIEELAGEVGANATVGKVNVDEVQELAAEFGVMTIPTVILFKDGKEVNRKVGIQPKPALLSMIQNA